MIFTPESTDSLRRIQRFAKDRYGDRYERLVAPYRGVIVKHCRETKKDPPVAAKELLGMLFGKGSLGGKPLTKEKKEELKVAVYSAAFDVIDRGILHEKEPSSLILPEGFCE